MSHTKSVVLWNGAVRVYFISGNFIAGGKEGLDLHQQFCLMNYFSQFLFNVFIPLYLFYIGSFTNHSVIYFILETIYLTLQHTLSLRNPADKCQPFHMCPCHCHYQHNSNIMSFSSVRAPSHQLTCERSFLSMPCKLKCCCCCRLIEKIKICKFK